MTTRKIPLRPPRDELTSLRNWHTLIGEIQQAEFDPFFGTTAVAAGFTNVDDSWGYYFTFGPLVFFSISLYSAGSITWAAASLLKLPFQAAQRGTSFYLEYGKQFPATGTGSGNASIDVFNLQSVTLSAEAGKGGGGAGGDVNISGWYFREGT